MRSTILTAITCPSCDVENAPSAVFCRNCGKELPKQCLVCGTPNPKRANFCKECGRTFIVAPAEEKNAEIAVPLSEFRSAPVEEAPGRENPLPVVGVLAGLTLQDRLVEIREKIAALPLVLKLGIAVGVLAGITSIVAVAIESQSSSTRPTFPSVSGPITYAANVGPFPTSFDCGSTTDWADQMVCHDRSLAETDIQVAAAYIARRDGLSDDDSRRALEVEQSKWLAKRDGCIGFDDPAYCLYVMYHARVFGLENP